MIAAADLHALKAAVGDLITVDGRVESVAMAPDQRMTFINFTGTSGGHFTAVLRGALAPFEAISGGPLMARLPGARIQLTGHLHSHAGAPSLYIYSTAQFQIVSP